VDAQKINSLLHSEPIPHHYRARVGERLEISLPRVPLTRHTEFLQLEKEKRGDLDSFVEEPAPEQGEGSLVPRQIVGRTLRPGKLHIVLSAKDSVSGEEIAGVEPLDILVEVED
jgi:hypothetical protein